MAKEKKNIVLRIPVDLHARVTDKRETIIGGMSFNKYAIVALENSLKPPVHLNDGEMIISKMTMLRLLSNRVVDHLIHKNDMVYISAYYMVFESIRTGNIHETVSAALRDITSAYEAT